MTFVFWLTVNATTRRDTTTAAVPMISEMAAQEREPGEKAQWIASIPGELESSFPAIDAIVWFDTPLDHEWWIDTSEASLEAFAELVRHPYFPGIDLSS